MARTSGFFEAQFDSSLLNPETQEHGDWDRKYLAAEFAKYFEMIVGNGVSGSTSDQLKVLAGNGYVTVRPGYAFINGYWFYNSEDYTIPIPTGVRYDTVRLRYSNETRNIDFYYKQDDESAIPVHTESVYDLVLARLTVSASSITVEDLRSIDQYCGIVNNPKELSDRINEKENSFDKNTAFNKNFGKTAGTVCEGNDARLSDSRKASDVYSWAKAANKPQYHYSEIKNTPTIPPAVAVKGENESSYRTGNVNITRENLGLKNVTNIGIVLQNTVPTSVAEGTIVLVYEE